MDIGIYQIRKIINNKVYIGSAQISFLRRKTQHWSDLKKLKHHSIYLQRAVNKYGIENFVFEILEECLPEDCIKREQYYIDTLKPEYNIRVIAQSNRGIKKTPEQIEKMKEIRKNCNWQITEEGRKAISDRHKGIPKTKEHSLKVSAANKKKIFQYDLDGNFIREWNGTIDVTIFYNFPKSSISKSLLKNKTCSIYKGFVWTYKDNFDYLEFPKIKERFLKVKREKKGFKLSEEHKNKIKNSNKGKRRSLEIKLHMKTKGIKSIIQYDKDMNFIKEWPSITSVYENININRSDIGQVASGKRKSAGGFIWKYKNIKEDDE